MCLIAKAIRISLASFIAIDLQLYKIFKIMQVSFSGTHGTVFFFSYASRELYEAYGRVQLHIDLTCVSTA